LQKISVKIKGVWGITDIEGLVRGKVKDPCDNYFHIIAIFLYNCILPVSVKFGCVSFHFELPVFSIKFDFVECSCSYEVSSIWQKQCICVVPVLPNCTLCCVQCHLQYFEWVAVPPTGYFLTSHYQFCTQLVFDHMSLLLLVC